MQFIKYGRTELVFASLEMYGDPSHEQLCQDLKLIVMKSWEDTIYAKSGKHPPPTPETCRDLASAMMAGHRWEVVGGRRVLSLSLSISFLSLSGCVALSFPRFLVVSLSRSLAVSLSRFPGVSLPL